MCSFRGFWARTLFLATQSITELVKKIKIGKIPNILTPYAALRVHWRPETFLVRNFCVLEGGVNCYKSVTKTLRKYLGLLLYFYQHQSYTCNLKTVASLLLTFYLVNMGFLCAIF